MEYFTVKCVNVDIRYIIYITYLFNNLVSYTIFVYICEDLDIYIKNNAVIFKFSNNYIIDDIPEFSL